MPEGVGTRLVVWRPANRWRGFLGSYRIEVDGADVGKVGRGRKLAVDVAAGVHEVRAVVAWTGSPTVRVTVPDGGTVLLKVEPSAGEVLHDLSTPDGWLLLTVDDDAAVET
jgi:hypothetical protein